MHRVEFRMTQSCISRAIKATNRFMMIAWRKFEEKSVGRETTFGCQEEVSSLIAMGIPEREAKCFFASIEDIQITERMSGYR